MPPAGAADTSPVARALGVIIVSMAGWEDEEDRAPICPACGVTALPREGANVFETAFVCENPDCEAFGDEV